MVDETNIYGSAVIYAVYFTVSPFISGSLSDFFCSFLGMVAETKVTWRLASVGLAQAPPKNIKLTTYKGKQLTWRYHNDATIPKVELWLQL